MKLILGLTLLTFTLASCDNIELDIEDKVVVAVPPSPTLTTNCADFDADSSYTCLGTSQNLNDGVIVWSEVTDTCNYFSINSSTGVITGTIPVGPIAACDYIIKAQDDSGATEDTTVSLSRSMCPSGFVPVLGNGTLGTLDFCVMKFEAKCTGSADGTGCDETSDIPVSQPANLPWRSSVNAHESFSSCARMSETNFTGTFRLIANPEWMTIARDIEQVDANWSGGVEGAGRLSVGHSDNSPSIPLAVSDVNDPYTDTGNNAAQADGSGWEQKRTHTLSNGAIIWDFAGNSWEWADWSAADGVATQAPTDLTFGWTEITAQAGTINPDDYLSLGGYDSSHGFGQIYGSANGGLIRGGAYNRGITIVGILAINLDANMNSGYGTTSFRCVYIP